MNIIMAIIGLVGLKRAPECIKMHYFEGENAKISALDSPDHISGYGPEGREISPPRSFLKVGAYAVCYSSKVKCSSKLTSVNVYF